MGSGTGMGLGGGGLEPPLTSQKVGAFHMQIRCGKYTLFAAFAGLWLIYKIFFEATHFAHGSKQIPFDKTPRLQSGTD